MPYFIELSKSEEDPELKAERERNRARSENCQFTDGPLVEGRHSRVYHRNHPYHLSTDAQLQNGQQYLSRLPNRRYQRNQNNQLTDNPLFDGQVSNIHQQIGQNVNNLVDVPVQEERRLERTRRFRMPPDWSTNLEN